MWGSVPAVETAGDVLMRAFRPGLMRNLLLLLGLSIVACAAACARAEEPRYQDFGLDAGFKGKRASAKAPAEFTAALVPAGQPGDVTLRISVTLPPDHYIYSTTPG